ncbi:hypothetical protein GCM10011428_39040 [Streptomyces violaceus]
MGTRTRFTYHEKDGEIWAEYTGGDVVRGHLVGTREGDRLDFRICTAQAGRNHIFRALCVSTVVELPDGRVRLRGELGVGVTAGQRDERLWSRSLRMSAD